VILLPAGFVISILCLAAYFTLDSALVLASSFMVPRQRPGRVALRLQGIAGALIGVFLFSLVYTRTDLHLFLYFAAAQAASAAVTEFVVARGTAAHHGANWCYAASAIAAVSAIALVLARTMESRQQSLVIYGYLGLLGFNFIALSAWMIFEERHNPIAQA
jgi:uncharacterized membrane protein YeaQ/YmgE (transglycosylase-associated protein family)